MGFICHIHRYSWDYPPNPCCLLLVSPHLQAPTQASTEPYRPSSLIPCKGRHFFPPYYPLCRLSTASLLRVQVTCSVWIHKHPDFFPSKHMYSAMLGCISSICHTLCLKSAQLWGSRPWGWLWLPTHPNFPHAVSILLGVPLFLRCGLRHSGLSAIS